VLYVWDRRDVLRAFLFNGERLQEEPWQTGNLASEMVGGISLSSWASMPGTGIVWATTAAENGNQTIVHGTLRAYDAADIQHELWNSDLLPERDSLGNFTKFASPVVANGKVYVVTQSNQLQVYGLGGDRASVSQSESEVCCGVCIDLGFSSYLDQYGTSKPLRLTLFTDALYPDRCPDYWSGCGRFDVRHGGREAWQASDGN
jgi:hypothetical protein